MLANHLRTVPTRYGDMTYLADDQYIGRGLELYGEYSELEVQLWRQLIKPGNTVLDAGANIGTLTLALADIVGSDGRVIAVEAQPETADLLKRNTEGRENIEVWECALGRASGTIKVPSLAALGHKNYGGVSLGGGELEVQIRPLDAFVARDRIDFIKADVEGMEIAVLHGARGTIKRYRPLLYLEYHPDKSDEELLRCVRSLGYRAFNHVPMLFNPDNFNKHQDNVFGNVASFNMLCVPVEKLEQYRDVTDQLTALIPSRPSCGKSEWVGIARLGGIGDNLIAASVLKPLKALGFKIDVITSMPQGVVFENNPYIDKLSVQRDLPKVHDEWQNWFYQRAVEYDKFVNLSHTCEVSLALLQNQTQWQWPPEARRKICGQSYLEFVHDIVGVPYDFGRLFWPTDEEVDHAQVTRRKYAGSNKVVGWVLTGTRPDKIYTRSAHAIARLIKELGVHVAMLGAPAPASDFTFAQQIEEEVKRTNSTTEGLLCALSPDPDKPTWPPRRVLTFAQNCDLVIGPDTGPMWGVAMEPMPKITLLSHASANNITKHWVNTVSMTADPQRVPCAPCHQLHNQPSTCIEEQRRCGMDIKPDAEKLGAACINDVSVETIVSTARQLLGSAHV